ncbi:DUF4871 domain-containing protein [Bacillus sp. MUM 13]|uniref:DUF4871 domain-containing protein n=1 Tax=Bacillus sp. MUM 13 TaxID=1678001 RepID=UPI0008F57FEE|nr:DUF4871 domain-containing protein [Bacillus sp. MUM 13]OIK14279.1 hypothetical protein BIV59_03215 [Bacillus sp. MUM 13]
MKFIHCILLAVLCLMLFACENDNEESKPAVENASVNTLENDEMTPPIEVDEKIIQEIDWEVSETFEAGNYTMRGIPNKVGFIDAPLIENKGNKYMWHFWGELPDGELTLIGIKKDSEKLVPVLTQENQHVWTYSSPAGPNNGADAHLPSNMRLPESGKWALLIYLGDKYFDNIIVNVK